MRRPNFLLLFSGAAVATSIGVFLGACDSPGKVGMPVLAGGDGTGGLNFKWDGSALGAGVGDDESGNSGAAPTSDANCGNMTTSTARVLTDVLLVLDRSGSMVWSTAKDEECAPNDPQCVVRWKALTTAVKTTLDSTAGGLNWGLKFFSTPNGSACEVNPGVEVQISSASVPDVQSQMDNAKPADATPTAQAIAAATNYLKTVKDTNTKVILLATDGEPNCNPRGGSKTPNVAGTTNAVAAAKTAGFPVYVIGMGPGDSVTNLNNFAKAGGTGKHFPATSPQALTDAFATISKTLATCTFTSEKAPSDPNNVAVYLDGNLVNQDPVNGWSYGTSTQIIELKGSSCAAVMSGTASKVQILFGCAGVKPPAIL